MQENSHQYSDDLPISAVQSQAVRKWLWICIVKSLNTQLQGDTLPFYWLADHTGERER